jgi:hypothetical protein
VPINEEKFNQLLGKFVADFGATLHAGMVVIGESLGLYKAMRDAGPLTSAELAERTDTRERYVREWLMAAAFPHSSFVGYDYHDSSIETARRRAEDAGMSNRVTFEIAHAKDFPGRGYDLVTFFDCLHDMGDPKGAAAHVRNSLAQDGTWMIVEPFAGDNVEDNLNPVGRIFYSVSTMVCTPASLAQEVGLALGAQAGEARLREVVTAGGFNRFRRTAETPFNLVFEAKP